MFKNFVFTLVMFSLLIGTTSQAQYVRFDQLTDTISVSGNSTMTNAITMEARIMFTSLDEYTSIFREWTICYEDKTLRIYDSILGGYIWPQPWPTAYLQSSVPVSLNNWYHVAYVYDSNEQRLYIDGTLVGSQTYNGVILNAIGGTWIGAVQGYGDATPAPSFQGYLDTFRLSTNARYSGTSFTAPQGDLTTDANTNLLYNFNEAVGSTIVHDLSGNGRDGTFGVSFDGATSPEIVSVVPEPTSLLVLSAGLLGLFGTLRRRRIEV